MKELTDVLLFLLPAGAANLVPPIAAKLFPAWNTPVDLGLTFNGKRLFGSHKTLRGIVFGILAATATFELECLILSNYPEFQNLFVASQLCSHKWMGPLFGIFALGGDLIKSFFKRRINVQPGQPWLPWDQIDWIIATLIGVHVIFKLELGFMLAALIMGTALTVLAKVIGYWIGVNKYWI